MLLAMMEEWLKALEARHLADLRVQEVTRALRALSSTYVERRHKVASGGALDSTGKRAAFALYYGPLHFLATQLVVGAYGSSLPEPKSILDIGCGTGAAGAAWAVAGGGTANVLGIDRHPWVVEEARWTYRHFKLRGHSRRGDLAKLPIGPHQGIVAAYVLNELDDEARARVESQLLDAGALGAPVLVLEPISRRVTPWWDGTAAKFAAAGGRSDEWRFDVELPPLLRLFDEAAGLDHRSIKVRTLLLTR